MSINIAIRIRHAIYNVRSLLAPHRYIVVHRGVPIRRLITVSSLSFPTSDVTHLEHITYQYYSFLDIYKYLDSK